jgi:hypothetical protein
MWGKKVIGRKRFVAVDTLGLLWALLVVPASVQDRAGGIALVERLHGAAKRLKKLWGDAHFDTALGHAWVRRGLAWGSGQEVGGSGRLCGAAQALDCGADVGLAQPLASFGEGLRAYDSE